MATWQHSSKLSEYQTVITCNLFHKNLIFYISKLKSVHILNGEDILMASHTFSQKKFTPTPPEKGSFPLDHENLCKRFYLKYMSCLRLSEDDNSKCRQQAKDYLGCRMENNLMETVQWSKLGFEDEEKAKAVKGQ